MHTQPRWRSVLFLALTLWLAPFSTALFAVDTDLDGVDDSIDIDDDGDNLIELYTLADLDLVRNDPDGTSLNGNTTGCMSCDGYELMADLNFDTNNNGSADSGDTYWNSKQGWIPVGKNDTTIFRARFEGNGHRIYNLYQNKTSAASAAFGLFGAADGAVITNLKLFNVNVSAYEQAGGLVGYATNTTIEGVRVSGVVKVNSIAAGGIVGVAVNGTTLRKNYSSVFAQTGTNVIGTLVGSASSSTLIEDCLAAGRLYGPASTATDKGQLVGSASDVTIRFSYGRGRDANLLGLVTGSNVFTANYWDATVSGSSSGTGGTSATTTELKCPVAAGDTTCKAGTTLFDGWSTGSWDFGTDSQYPELIFNSVVQRDTDGDFFMDAEDAFPDNVAASQDADADGLPDAWNLSCRASCQTASGLTLDNDPTDAAPTIVLADPINVDEGTTLILDASASFDPDGSITLIEWDLNNDGTFDDAVGEMVDLGLQADNTSFDIAVRMTDNAGGVSTATRTVNVVNLPPQTSATPVAVLVNGSVDITLVATDVAADTITSYDIVTPPTKGVLSGTGSALTYTPNLDEVGDDSFTFTATDDDGGTSSVQTVTISIYTPSAKKKSGGGASVLLVIVPLLGVIRRRRHAATI